MKKKKPTPPCKPNPANYERSAGALRSVSEHAQGFVFGLAVGIFGTLGVLWAIAEPIIR